MKLFWGVVVQLEVRTSSQEREWHFTSRASSAHLGPGKANVTGLGLDCGVAKANWLEQRKILGAWEWEEKGEDYRQRNAENHFHSFPPGTLPCGVFVKSTVSQGGKS